MRFCSCSLLLNSFIFAFALAVRLGGEVNSHTFRKRDEALSAQDDAVAPTDLANVLPVSSTSDDQKSFNQQMADKASPLSTDDQPPPRDSTRLSNLIPGTGFSLLAQSRTDDAPVLSGVGSAAAATLTYALDLLGQGADNVGDILRDVFQSKETDAKEQGGRGGAGATNGKQRGTSGRDSETPLFYILHPCQPSERFGSRALPWCDVKRRYLKSVEERDDGTFAVHGYWCMIRYFVIEVPNHPFSYPIQYLNEMLTIDASTGI